MVAHFDTVLSLGVVFGLMVGWYALSYLWSASAPYEGLALVQIWTLLGGAGFIFGPMHALGIIGMSRRVPEFGDVYLPYIQLGTVGTLYVVFSVLVLLRGWFMSNCDVSSCIFSGL